MTLNKKKIDRIITACFESEEMREHLMEHSSEITHRELIDIIRGAPIPLDTKAGLIQDVDETCYKEIKAALDALDLRDDQFFLYSWGGNEMVNGRMEKDQVCIGPCRDLSKVREHLAEELFDVPSSDELWEHRKEEMYWAELDLYEPDGQNGFRNLYTYHLIADRICYFHRNYQPLGADFWCSTCRLDYSWNGVHLNVDIPFQPGDIVTVDSRPFAGVKHIVILETGTDCCAVQGLYWNGRNNRWDTGAVKHGSIYDETMPMISPLYRMGTLTDPLEEGEKYLLEVSHQIAGDAETGRKIWREFNGYGEERNG